MYSKKIGKFLFVVLALIIVSVSGMPIANVLALDNGSTGIILADFGASQAGNLYGLSDWTIPIKDTYTNYREIGPGGTTITIGSNGSYDYQGIRGSATEFREGDRILVTWYDNSDSPVAFTPKISFDDPNRPGASYSPGEHGMT